MDNNDFNSRLNEKIEDAIIITKQNIEDNVFLLAIELANKSYVNGINNQLLITKDNNLTKALAYIIRVDNMIFKSKENLYLNRS